MNLLILTADGLTLGSVDVTHVRWSFSGRSLVNVENVDVLSDRTGVPAKLEYRDDDFLVSQGHLLAHPITPQGRTIRFQPGKLAIQITAAP